MKVPAASKYSPFPRPDFPERTWPSKTVPSAPIWCSVDLRDGNQALAQPMSVSEKLEYFEMLVAIGFKEIEVGFPAASQTDYDFCRCLIDEGRIPSGVSIQVLCQCREDLILRTLDAIAGASNAIFHLYNSTSPKQREYVFGASRADIIHLAVASVGFLKENLSSGGHPGLRLEYSPESFNSTELDFALEISNAVVNAWGAPIILNLPATVEYSTPNVYADQIEWMSTHLANRDKITLSVHTHNDRGTGVAATELAMLAGAERVEGTLFGIGERTGNLDIVTVALNLYTHGVDPGLDFERLEAIRCVYEKCTRMSIPVRHPYIGELAFTAFSGSHQDAIKKSLACQGEGRPWDTLYIPIDPSDIGRSYEKVVRINSQSGKGGVAYVLEQDFGIILPRFFQKEMGRIVNELSDKTGAELSSDEVLSALKEAFLNLSDPIKLATFNTVEADGKVTCSATLIRDNERYQIRGKGNGPIAAFVDGIQMMALPGFEVASYAEHSLGSGANTDAIGYIQIVDAAGVSFFGAGQDPSIELASIKALMSALNNKMKRLS